MIPSGARFTLWSEQPTRNAQLFPTFPSIYDVRARRDSTTSVVVWVLMVVDTIQSHELSHSCIEQRSWKWLPNTISVFYIVLRHGLHKFFNRFSLHYGYLLVYYQTILLCLTPALSHASLHPWSHPSRHISYLSLCQHNSRCFLNRACLDFQRYWDDNILALVVWPCFFWYTRVQGHFLNRVHLEYGRPRFCWVRTRFRAPELLS